MTTIPTLPGRLPFLGHAFRFALSPLAFIESARDSGDIVVFHLGKRPAYLVNTADLVREVLVTQYDSFAKGGPFYAAVASLAGNGIVLSNGAFHRRQRRLMQPAFQQARIASYAVIMADLVAAMSDSWHAGSRIDVNRTMNALSVSALTKCLFSETLGIDLTTTFQEALPSAMKGMFRRTTVPIGWLHRLPTPGNRRYQREIDRIHTTVDLLIAGYRTHGIDRGDLLSMLLLACDEETGEPISDQQVHDEVVTLLVAGSETTAVVLSWAFLVLGTHHDIEQQVLSEVDRVLGGRPATFEDIGKLSYLGRFIQEVLRLYAPVWILTRRTVTDIDLGGHRIPADSDVFFSPFALHRDGRHFDRPNTFDPDRWLPGRPASLERGTCIPFSSGVRRCLGESFATVEVTLALATLTSHWRLRPTSNRPSHGKTHVTYFPASLTMTVEPRRHDRVNPAAGDGRGDDALGRGAPM